MGITIFTVFFLQQGQLCVITFFYFPYFPFEIVLKCVGIKEHFTKYLLTFAYMIHKWGNLMAYFSKQRTLDHKFPVRIPGWDDPFQMLDSLPFHNVEGCLRTLWNN